MLLPRTPLYRVPASYFRAEGTMKNVNTIEEYRNADKVHLLQESGRTVSSVVRHFCSNPSNSFLLRLWLQIWEAIIDGSIYSSPSLLSSFLVLSYADLKKYKFHYWFAFPALHSDPSWTMAGPSTQSTSLDIVDGAAQHVGYLSTVENSTLTDAVQDWSSTVDARQRGFFLARRLRDPSDKTNHADETDPGVANTTSDWQVDALSTYENGFFDGVRLEDSFVCFVDPSNYEDAPGWMLRNLLVLARHRWGLDRIRVLRYREAHSKRDQGRSLVMTLETQTSQATRTSKLQNRDSTPMPRVTGWERNATGKLTGRLVDLTEYLDPKRYKRPPPPKFKSLGPYQTNDSWLSWLLLRRMSD